MRIIMSINMFKMYYYFVLHIYQEVKMTKFIFVRHANPDYSKITNADFAVMNDNLAHLSEEGIKQAKELAQNPIFRGADVLISSPYTRTMQTASYISLATNLPIICEFDLHEWVPDVKALTPDNRDKIVWNYKLAVEEYNRFECNSNNLYEPLIVTQERVSDVLVKYLDYSKVIVVVHAGVLYSLTGKRFKQAEYMEWCI